MVLGLMLTGFHNRWRILNNDRSRGGRSRRQSIGRGDVDCPFLSFAGCRAGSGRL